MDDNSPDLIEKMCREYIGYKQNGEHPWDNPDKKADDFAFHLRERMRRVLKVVEVEYEQVGWTKGWKGIWRGSIEGEDGWEPVYKKGGIHK